MIWFQALLSFVAWVGYGFWLRRSSESLKVKMRSLSRGVRTLLGSVGLLLGLAALAIGLLAISRSGGLTESGLKPWAWVAVTVLGAMFVHLQTIGAAAMVSLVLEEVTASKGRSSVKEKETP